MRVTNAAPAICVKGKPLVISRQQSANSHQQIGVSKERLVGLLLHLIFGAECVDG